MPKFQAGDERARVAASKGGKAKAAAQAPWVRRRVALPRFDSVADAWRVWPEFAADSWAPWRAALRATFGEPLSPPEAEVVRAATGRVALPAAPARELWCVVGRRGGKSRVAALLATYLAVRSDYRDVLAAGETGVVAVLAASREQARVVLHYVRALLSATPELRALVLANRAESVSLKHGVTLEIHTSSYRLTRGRTLVGVVLDEVCFWQADENSRNPDAEVVRALRPGLATVPGSLLVAISSPHARRGEMWRVYERSWGKGGDVIVWTAPSRTMNPTIPEAVVEQALADDPESAKAEWLGEFRQDVSSLFDPEAIAAVVVAGRRELPPAAGVRYCGFVDMSGGSVDAAALGIAHRAGDVAVLDGLRVVPAPHSPENAVREFCETLKPYGVRRVVGDKYAGEWPREAFRKHGVEYVPSSLSKSDIYQAALPLVNSGRCELLDVAVLRRQLEGLERRVARGGRESIDHGPMGHDDASNAACGALTLAAGPALDRTLRITAAVPDGAGGLYVGPAAGERCGVCYACRSGSGYPCVRDDWLNAPLGG